MCIAATHGVCMSSVQLHIDRSPPLAPVSPVSHALCPLSLPSQCPLPFEGPQVMNRPHLCQTLYNPLSLACTPVPVAVLVPPPCQSSSVERSPSALKVTPYLPVCPDCPCLVFHCLLLCLKSSPGSIALLPIHSCVSSRRASMYVHCFDPSNERQCC